MSCVVSGRTWFAAVQKAAILLFTFGLFLSVSAAGQEKKAAPLLPASSPEMEAGSACSLPDETDLALAEPQDTLAVQTPLSGSAEAGKALFLGSARFASGGAPCASCHTAGPFGTLGGRSLAADLTTLYDDLGPEGIADVLDNPEFPIMSEIYRNRPFTEKEKQDLIAFFAGLSQQEAAPPSSGFAGKLELFGILGALLFFILMIAFKPRQKDMFEILRRKS
jgi:hypothetical protein